MTHRFNRNLHSQCGRYGALPTTRREMLQRAGLGFGSLALAGLVAREGLGKSGALGSSATGHLTHFSPRARNVIFLFMGGGPSQIDTFDPKPELSRLDGKETPESIRKLFQRTATMGNGTRKLMGSPFRFQRYGKSGLAGLRPAPGDSPSYRRSLRCAEHAARHIDSYAGRVYHDDRHDCGRSAEPGGLGHVWLGERES